MKKILSLVLVVLMLASLAISTSAASYLYTDNGIIKINDRLHAPSNVDLMELYAALGYVPGIYGDPIYVNGQLVYTWWYGDCPECDGIALMNTDANTIKYSCLDNDEHKGTWYTAPQLPDTGSGNTGLHGAKCTNCQSTNTIYLSSGENFNGQIRDRYYCTSCKEDFYLVPTSNNPGNLPSLPSREIKCHAKNCTKKAVFTEYSVSEGKLYALYVCTNGHTNRLYLSDDTTLGNYTLRVSCSLGGAYRVIGGANATYGETKTIVFYPFRGYVLTDVYVNGQAVTVNADDSITITVKSNTVIRANFEKKSNLKDYTITTKVEGNGYVVAVKDNKTVSADKITANASNSVTLYFESNSGNYRVSTLYVDGKKITNHNGTYTFDNVRANHTVEVTYVWDNPFIDVAAKYEKAVEYVTEAGIIDASSTGNTKTNFSGAKAVTVKTFAASLAEMADTNDVLDTTAERIRWAEKYGLIDKETDLNATCNVQTACALVRAFLEALEEINHISFVDLKYLDSVEETAVAIGMVSAKTYEKNRNLNRYDLAAVCYLISRLEYKD